MDYCGYDEDRICKGMENCTKTFACKACGVNAPWCFGGSGDELCDKCFSNQQNERNKMENKNEIKISLDGNSIEFNGVKYLRGGTMPTVMTFGGKNPLPNAYAGKFVIIRSRNEGINAGTLSAADETGCILEKCRRLWNHSPKDKSLSWYEGVAISGIAAGHKVSATVDAKVIVEDYSITLCSDAAEKSIMSETPNAQN